jgi:signal transduction histidine kinase
MAGSATDEAWVEEPGRTGLWLGILAYRWVSFAWMTILAVLVSGDFRRPELAWAAIGATFVWNLWLTVNRGWERPAVRWFDLGLSTALIVVSGLVVETGGIVSGRAPFFATAYPVSSAMTWGAAGSVGSGLGSAAALSVALALSRQVNGTPLSELDLGQLAAFGNGVVYYLSAGGAVGLVSRVLRRTGAQLRAANESAVRERERAAALAEREAIARRIHDSVLQALSLVNKRGKELGSQVAVSGREVRTLAEMAAQQERALRSLIAREPEEPPSGKTSLREALESVAQTLDDLPVTVTTTGPLWLPAHHAAEIEAAVREALTNAAEHAQAARVTVFAERDGDQIVVSVRDDGVGFEYDEARLERLGKLGLRQSVKGRIEDLGGTVRVDSEPGRGTEIELRVPETDEPPLERDAVVLVDGDAAADAGP